MKHSQSISNHRNHASSHVASTKGTITGMPWKRKPSTLMATCFMSLILASTGGLAQVPRRELAEQTYTIQVSVPSSCPVLDIQTLQPTGTRDSCVQKCSTSGPLEYSVERNSTLNINLVSSPPAVVIIGGSKGDKLMDTAVLDLTVQTAPADSSGTAISPVTFTKLIFRPLRAWYPAFLLNNVTERSTGTLAVYTFNAQVSDLDRAADDFPDTGLPARACRFDIKLTVIPSSLPATNVTQLSTSSASPLVSNPILSLVAALIALLPFAAML